MRKGFLLSATAIIMAACCNNQEIKVACVGDSITEGYGLKCQSETGYPVVLNKLLGDNYIVQNCGRSGATMQKKTDLSYWACNEFSNAVALKPDIVIIKLGTNDSKPYNWNSHRFAEDYQAMIDTFNAIGKPKIYLCTPAPALAPNWNINDSIIVTQIIPIIDSLANNNNLPVIDLHNGMANLLHTLYDSIHPNEAGAEAMAKMIAEEIAKQ